VLDSVIIASNVALRNLQATIWPLSIFLTSDWLIGLGMVGSTADMSLTSRFLCWTGRAERCAATYGDQAQDHPLSRKVRGDRVRSYCLLNKHHWQKALFLQTSLGSRCAARKFRTTTTSKHRHPVAEDLLGRDFTADRPNQRWVADITHVPVSEG